MLARELKNLDETPPEGIRVGINNDDFSISADIEDLQLFEICCVRTCMRPLLTSIPLLAVGTPYKNGYFLTEIFYQNIATNGKICVNTLKKDWNPSLGLRHVPLVVRCLLIEPFPESALNEQAGKMLLENYEEYTWHARPYTGIHAKPKPKLKQGAIFESMTALNVDQTNTPSENVDPLNSLPSTVAAGKGATRTGQPAALGPSNENVVSGSATAPPKKAGGALKTQADKKKIDARKNSLKRL